MYRRTLFTVFLFGLAIPLFPQAAPSATGGGDTPWSLGAGLSNIYPDYSYGRMYGGTLWIDYSLRKLPSLLRNAGFELEARDVSLDRSPSNPFLREDSAGVGGTYTIYTFHGVHLYGKFLAGLGNADYMVGPNRRFNQSRTVTSFGGGLQYGVSRTIYLRFEYEYQNFPDFFIGPNYSGTLNPQGFTLGALYRFRTRGATK